MKKEENKIKYRKMIGKNCTYNKEILIDSYKIKKRHTCIIKHSQCGSKHECDCFDSKGRLQFQAKEE